MKAMSISNNQDGPVIRIDDPSSQEEQHFLAHPARIARPMSAQPELSEPSSPWKPSILLRAPSALTPHVNASAKPCSTSASLEKKALHRNLKDAADPVSGLWEMTTPVRSCASGLHRGPLLCASVS